MKWIIGKVNLFLQGVSRHVPAECHGYTKVCTETADACNCAQDAGQNETKQQTEKELEQVRASAHKMEVRRETIISVIIFVNCITVGVELDIPWDGWWLVNLAFLSVYVVNLVLTFRTDGKETFFSSYWNWVDMTVVSSNIVETGLFLVRSRFHTAPRVIRILTLVLRLFRLLRILRIFILIKAFDPLYSLAHTLREALSAVLWFMVLIFVLVYAFALVFRQLFGQDDMSGVEVDDLAKRTFRTVPHSFFVLFRVMNADTSELSPILSGTDGFILPTCYMVFMLSASWLAMSALTATIVDKTLSVRDKQKRQQEISYTLQSAEVVNEGLRELFEGNLATNKRDEVDLDGILQFMKREDNAQRLHELCQVHPHEAVGLFNAMQIEGVLSLEDYIDKLIHLRSYDTASCVMRLETQIRQLSQVVANMSVQIWQLQDHVNQQNQKKNGTSGDNGFLEDSPESDVSPENGRSQRVPVSMATEGSSPARPPDWIFQAAGIGPPQGRQTSMGTSESADLSARDEGSDVGRHSRTNSIGEDQNSNDKAGNGAEASSSVQPLTEKAVSKIASLGAKRRRNQVFVFAESPVGTESPATNLHQPAHETCE